MKSLRYKVRSHLIVPVLWAMLAGHSFGQDVSLTGEKVVEAAIDNHGALIVRYDEDDLSRVTIETVAANGTVKTYLWSGNDGVISTKELDVEETITQAEDSAKYGQTLRKMRDFIAYAAGPERYDWLVFGASLVRPELNQLIETIDASLDPKTRDDVNCQLLITHDGATPLVVSGGAFGDLGENSVHVTKVWVKKGYTLVLVSNPLFDTSANVKLVRVVGDERRAKTELPKAAYDSRLSDLVGSSDGTTYTLSGTLMEGSVRSFICRPDLRG